MIAAARAPSELSLGPAGHGARLPCAQGHGFTLLLVAGLRGPGVHVGAVRRGGVFALADRLRAEQGTGALAAPRVLPADPPGTGGRLRTIGAVGIGVTGGGV